MRYSRRAARVAASLAGLALAVSALPILADQTAGKTVGPFTGTVVDAAGKPVAGATVWLLTRDDSGKSNVVAETASDEKGRFRIAEVSRDDSSGAPRPLMLTARDSQGRIGGQVRSFSSGPPVPEARSTQFRDMQIALQDVKDYRGRLTDTSGQPMAKAGIRVESCWFDRFEPSAGKSYAPFTFPPSLRTCFENHIEFRASRLDIRAIMAM